MITENYLKYIQESKNPDIQIIPKVGAGPIKLGMDRKEVRKILGSSGLKPFKRGGEGELEDAWFKLGIYVSYKRNKCEYIMLTNNSNPIFKNKNLFKFTYKQAINFLKKYDKESNEGVFKKLGIDVWTDIPEENELKAVGIFGDKYHDN